MTGEAAFDQTDLPDRVIRFGPFELDARAGELNNRGRCHNGNCWLRKWLKRAVWGSRTC